MVTVMNLLTGEKFGYTCPPYQAVVACYAQQELHDWNTWQYKEKYYHLVEIGKETYLCGNCSVYKDGREFYNFDRKDKHWNIYYDLKWVGTGHTHGFFQSKDIMKK